MNIVFSILLFGANMPVRRPIKMSVLCQYGTRHSQMSTSVRNRTWRIESANRKYVRHIGF